MRIQQRHPDQPQGVAPDPSAHTDPLRLWLASGIHKFPIDPRRRRGGQSRARRLLTEEPVFQPAPTDAWQWLAPTLDRHTLLGGMAEMGLEERRVFTLAYLEGRTNRDIAAMQGVSVSRVRRRLQGALKRVDECLARAGSWLSAMLLLGAGWVAATSARLGRSAAWGEGLVSTTAVGAVAVAAIVVTAASLAPTSARSAVSHAVVHGGAAVPRGQDLGLAVATLTVSLTPGRSEGARSGIDSNGRKTRLSAPAGQGHGAGHRHGPTAVPPGLLMHNSHAHAAKHPPPGTRRG